MGNAAKYFMFFKWKSKILVCLCIFHLKNVGQKGTILLTNHFDLGWKENSLIKVDWDPVELSRKTVQPRFQGSLLPAPWKTVMIPTKLRPPPRGLLGLIFAGYVPLASQGLYPIIVYFLANCRPHISHFGANM